MHKKIIQKEQAGISGKITLKVYKAGTQELLRTIVQKNMIMKAPNVGMDMIIQRLCSVNTYSLNINYGAIGTGSTAVAVTDTKLETETNRAAVNTDQQNVGNNQAKLKFFFPDGSLSNGTYYEFGTFVGGSITLNTGQIFNHALFSIPYVKTGGTDTMVEVDISLS